MYENDLQYVGPTMVFGKSVSRAEQLIVRGAQVAVFYSQLAIDIRRYTCPSFGDEPYKEIAHT